MKAEPIPKTVREAEVVLERISTAKPGEFIQLSVAVFALCMLVEDLQERTVALENP